MADGHDKINDIGYDVMRRSLGYSESYFATAVYNYCSRQSWNDSLTATTTIGMFGCQQNIHKTNIAVLFSLPKQ